MDDELTCRMINLAWEKVSAAQSEPAPADVPAQIRGFITSEHDFAALLAHIAPRITSPRVRSALCRALADASRRERLLQAEYFILTGDTFAPPVPVGECAPPLAALRFLLARAEKSADAYRAASYASDAPLADTYSRLSAEQTSLAAVLRRIIYSLF